MKRLVPIGAIIVLAALAIWWFLPTQRMKRRVASMIETANVPSNMMDVARKTRGTNLAKYLAPEIRIDAPENTDERLLRDSIDRDRATVYYSGAASLAKRISLADLKIGTISFDGDTAKVGFELDAIVELPGRTPIDGILVVDSHWIHSDEEGWRMDAIGWLERPR